MIWHESLPIRNCRGWVAKLRVHEFIHTNATSSSSLKFEHPARIPGKAGSFAIS